MKKVLLFLAQGFEEFEASAFTDVFGWSGIYCNTPVMLITAGLRQEVKCTWNFRVKPELDLSAVDVNDFDALAIPGGFEEAGFYEDAFDHRFLSIIREFDKQKKFIASVCVGAIPIARSGVLKGRKATTYDFTGNRRAQLASYGAVPVEGRIVIDDNIITSTGPATATDVAFALLEKLTDEENVRIIKEYMRFI